MISDSKIPRSGHQPSGAVEYEREQVPEHALKGPRSFIGMYAGEHTAGTEFMIGPLFLAAGVSAIDLILGLLVGNLLAVLSWALVCAPIATKTRQTLYYRLEMICGERLVTVYNLANGILFCFLAGAMISVSATAVGVPFEMKMPELNDWLPNSVGWVITVFAVGVAISFVAAWGYDSVSRVANIAAPWMILVFLACGFTALPKLGIESFSEFWATAQSRIWTGGDPLMGQTKFTIWHVIFFAWFCNGAMHLGMADLSIFRYARKWHYGFASAIGMYMGHFLAWIAASLLYAAQLARDPAHTTVAPGPMAYEAVGVAGLACVIVAGWTTANPTIYRAGLAFQAILPRSSRYTVTLCAGGVATVAALFPALAMKLLGFVALYGTILMPMGAIIVVDFVLFPRLGLIRDFAFVSKSRFNGIAAIAWLAPVFAACWLWTSGYVQIYFLALPAWIFAGLIYLILGRLTRGHPK